MSTGRLDISLTSPSWGTGSDAVAVAEVVAVSSSGTRGPAIKLPLGVNSAPEQVDLDAGTYMVRVFLPSGDVQAERVHVGEGSREPLSFEIGASPHEWLGAAAGMGIVQTLPHASEARLLEATLTGVAPTSVRRGPEGLRSPRRALLLRSAPGIGDVAKRAIVSLQRTTNEVQRISGRQRVLRSEGWRWITRVDPNRSWPAADGRLSTRELVRWWCGDPVGSPARLDVTQSDERNARLAARGPADHGALKIGGAERAFAAVRDPIGGTYYAVLPEGWSSTSRSRVGQPVSPSILLTVVVDTAMTAAESRATPARWRCAPEIDDVEAMSLLGFLLSGQAEAGQMMLERAQSWLFEKTVNPVAAAAGAYMLLSHTEEANGRLSSSWRRWIGNLYSWFPYLPDGAIALARMALAYGESSRGEEIDVEKLRHYALEAVRRGLPYLGAGVRMLTEVLIALVGDDRAEGRSGPLVEDTQRALSLVRQLGRITVPGEFFTVLRLDGERT